MECMLLPSKKFVIIFITFFNFTKFRYAATAITECVRQELQFLDETVKVTSITPGLVQSDLVYVIIS